jgi:ArsR family transcriptional regulator
MSSLENEVHQLHSQLCAGLADPKRILMLYALSQQSMNVSELSEQLQLPQPTTSRHLKMLRERGLVSSDREGTSVYYTITDKRVIDALDLLREVLADRLQQQANLAESAGQISKSP